MAKKEFGGHPFLTTSEFIQQARDEDVARVAMRVRQYPEVDAAFALQQIEGYQKACIKLPALAAVDGWIWPKRLSMEQCSSEETARYKRQILRRLMPDCVSGADLTGGLGVDTFYLSEGLTSWHYVEMQQDLCDIAEQNFRTAGRTNISVHCTSAEAFLDSLPSPSPSSSAIFLDPARRDGHGGKVFRLEDCTPDLTQLYPALMERCQVLMLKLSPMLDISEALRHLPDACEVHVVAVRGEVKELLVVCQKDASPLRMCAINLKGEAFVFSPQEETEAVCPMAESVAEGLFLYEPNAAVMKAGAFRLVGQRFGLQKAAQSTHLYLSAQKQEDFPGRIFCVKQVLAKQEMKALAGLQLNIICRNYPLRPDELKKKLRTRDGGTDYVLAFRLADKPVLVLCSRLK